MVEYRNARQYGAAPPELEKRLHDVIEAYTVPPPIVTENLPKPA